MSLFRICTAALVFAVVAVPSSRADEKDDLIKKDVAALKGTWVVESGESQGEPFPKGAAANYKLVLDGNNFTFFMTGRDPKDLREAKGTFTIDPTQKPKHLNLETDFSGTKTVSPAIYSLDGDTLKVVIDEKDKTRAKEFATEKTGSHLLFVFKRKKEREGLKS